MKIFTYYEEALPDQLDLIELWKESWLRMGWEPHVLGLKHAKDFPEFDRLDALLFAKPAVNPKAYEMTCFRRWMAMASIGGGWMCDYDVVNMSLEPIKYEGFIIGCGHVPCLVCARPIDYADTIRKMAMCPPAVREIVNKQEHFSDQYFLSVNQSLFRKIGICDELGQHGKSSYTIHCCAGACHKAGGSKKSIMENLVAAQTLA